MKKSTIQLTELERDLIELGRNYKKNFPNGASELRYFVERLFYQWLDERN